MADNFSSRVAFGLDANQVFDHDPEYDHPAQPRAYKRRRSSSSAEGSRRRRRVVDRNAHPLIYERYARSLERAAHDNAVKTARHDKAEGVMVLLGKMRYHPVHSRAWAETGRDAVEEDRMHEAEEQTRRFCDELLTTYARDRPEKERLSIDEVGRFLLSSGL